MKKFFAAMLVAAVCFLGVPFMSGCSASVSYMLNEEGTGYVVRGTGYLSALKGEYVIPAYYGEGEQSLPVTEIADQAFSGSSLSRITVPATVTKIGTAAFSYSYSLQEVVFSQEAELDEIPWGAFGYCTALRTIEIPESVTAISGMAFYNCSSLQSVAMPDGLKSIGVQAFVNCSSLSSIEFPDELTTIGDLAFYSAGLTEAVIPAGVCDTMTESTDAEGNVTTKTTYGIGLCAFHTCVSLTRVVILGSIEIVRSGAFGYCTSLKELYLPASLKWVEGVTYDSGGNVYCGHAFHNNTSMTDVYYAGNEEQWGQIEIANQSVSVNGAVCDNSALVNATKHYGASYNGSSNGAGTQSSQ